MRMQKIKNIVKIRGLIPALLLLVLTSILVCAKSLKPELEYEELITIYRVQALFYLVDIILICIRLYQYTEANSEENLYVDETDYYPDEFEKLPRASGTHIRIVSGTIIVIAAICAFGLSLAHCGTVILWLISYLLDDECRKIYNNKLDQ